MNTDERLTHGIKINRINAGNISFLSRAALEHAFLHRERTRDAAIGAAFLAGGLFAAVFGATLLFWLP